MNLQGLFTEQVRRTPDAPAVVDGDRTLTYRALHERSGALAAELQRRGLGRDGICALFMEKSLDYVVAYVATLRAGGAYLPLDLAYPDAFIERVLAEAEPAAVLTHRGHGARLPDGVDVLDFEGGWPEGEPAELRQDPEDLAFVVYSSGTTGAPKGILMPHHTATFSYASRHAFDPYGAGARVACNIFFVWEILRPLLVGGCVHVLRDEVIADAGRLADFLASHRITETLFTPSLAETLLGVLDERKRARAFAHLRTLWLNGEVVSARLRERLLDALPSSTRLLNTYSISECHDVAHADLRAVEPRGGACPVGAPVAGVEARIVDVEGRPVAPGAVGELLVGGPGVGHGYLKRPALTAQRFVAHEDRRYYRTGDWARLREDGLLEIRGRCDSMVKLRGYSVDLGAVETALRAHANVDQCAVRVQGPPGGRRRLVAYVVPGPAADWRVEGATGLCVPLQAALRPHLPHYMMPAAFVQLGALPLDPVSGKLSARALPPPPQPSARAELDGLSATDAATVAALWAHVLQQPPGSIDPTADFFAVGGDSLLAMEVVSLVDDVLGHDVPATAVYAHPTPARFAAWLRGEAEVGADDVRADARLSAAIEPVAPRVVSLREAREVLLTGATGFLGASLLDEILRLNPRVRVHCLVRAGDAASARRRLAETARRDGLSFDAARVRPLVGDLAQPLPALDTARLDLVIHCAAAVNHLHPYAALRTSTVDGTRRIIALACRAGAALHHVSTNGVFPADRTDACPETPAADDWLDGLSTGYGRLKWAAERLVTDASARGLPTRVYRPGNIGPHRESGAWNHQDLQFRVLDAARRVELAPTGEGWWFEATPVDHVARVVTELASVPTGYGRIYNVVNPAPLNGEAVLSAMHARGLVRDRVPFDDWRAELARADDEALTMLAGALPELEIHLRHPGRFERAELDAALAALGLARPEVGVDDLLRAFG